MLLITFLTVLSLTLIGYYVSRDIFSPFVIQPGVWFAIIGLYYIVQPAYFPICHDLPICVSLWCLSFAVGAYVVYVKLPAERGLLSAQSFFLAGDLKPSRTVLKVYFLLSVVTIPLMLYMLINKALNRGEGNIFLYLRVSVIDDTLERPDFGLANYLVPLVLVLLVFVMVYVKSKKAKVAVVVLNILAGVLTMSKTSFFVVLIVILYVLYMRKKIKAQTIGLWMLIFVAFSVGFQFLRGMGQGDDDTFSVFDMLALYTMSPLVAFDYYAVPGGATFFGENVFRIYYAVMHTLGSDIRPVDNILKFVGVPDLTNTYTILYPFYTDFGLAGVTIFGAVYGAFFGFLYKRSDGGNSYYKALYACFINYLALQFVQENFFYNLSLNIQYIVFFIIPYVFSTPLLSRRTKPLPHATED